MSKILLVPHRDGRAPLLVHISSFSGIYPEEGGNRGSGPQHQGSPGPFSVDRIQPGGGEGESKLQPGAGEDETRQTADSVGAGY